MDTNIKVQFYIFLTSLYGGLIAGLAYDIYRATRHYFKPKKIVTTIEDFLFWVGIALIFFYIVSKSNEGGLRGYIFIGFFSGGFIYIKLLSKVFFSLWIRVFDGIILFIKSIANIIILPLKQLEKILSPRIKKIKRIPIEAINNIKRYRKIISKKK